MVDWSAHYDAIYSALGVVATLTLAVDDSSYSLTALDKTGGIQVGDDASVASVKPAAVVRMYELAEQGVSRSQLGDSRLTINGVEWIIKSTLPRPAPTGEAAGELFLILSSDES